MKSLITSEYADSNRIANLVNTINNIQNVEMRFAPKTQSFCNNKKRSYSQIAGIGILKQSCSVKGLKGKRLKPCFAVIFTITMAENQVTCAKLHL